MAKSVSKPKEVAKAVSKPKEVAKPVSKPMEKVVKKKKSFLETFAPKKPKNTGGNVGRDIFDADIMDYGNNAEDSANLSPESTAAMKDDIRRLQDMYGDDRDISLDELDRMCGEIISRYGLDENKFTEDEMYDPNTDPELEAQHPSVVGGHPAQSAILLPLSV